MMAEASGSPVKCQLDVDEENNHVLELMRKINQMRTEKRKCDVIIKVEGKEIHVHCNVMMSGSDFFDVMFSNDMKENSSGIVEMKDITFYIMQKCIVYIYTGKISIVEDECEDLLYAAGKMQLTKVCDKIARFLESHLNPKFYFKAKRIAVKFSLEKLNKVCDEFALQNLHLLVEEAEFNDVGVEDIKFFISAKTVDEDSKLAVILQWVKADTENRHFLPLAKLLDYEEVSAECGRYIAKNEEVCNTSLEFMTMLYLGTSQRGDIKSRSPTVSSTSVQKVISNSIVVFDKKSKALQAYGPRSKSWKKLNALHEDMLEGSKYTAVMARESIYVLMMGSKKFYRIRFTEKAAAWSRMADMLEERDYCRAVVLDGFIYVGGDRSMERYNLSKNEWLKVDCSEVRIDWCALVEHQRSIYTIGGWRSGCGVINDVNEFSPSSLTWSSIPSMKVARRTPAAAAYCEKIYVAGGFTNRSLSYVECYDFNSKTWTTLSSMVIVHDEFGLFALDDKLFAVGDRKEPNYIEEYDFETKKWKVVETMPGMDLVSLAIVAVP